MAPNPAPNPTRTPHALRFDLAGRWTCDDFTRLCRINQELYSLALRIESFVLTKELQQLVQPDSTNSTEVEAEMSFLHSLVEYRPALYIGEIIYASPGHIDFLGVGAAIKHVKDFIQWTAEFYDSSSKKKRSLENELLEQKVIAEKIKNAKAVNGVLKSSGFTKEQTHEAMGTILRGRREIEDFADRGLITNVSLVQEKKDDDDSHPTARAGAAS